MNETYDDFLHSKIEVAPVSGFQVPEAALNPALKPHQRDAVLWAIKGGRRALFESFGLGKTVQELEWCRLVAQHEGGKVLIVLPLGVRQEFCRDAVELLGMEPPAYIRTMAEAEAATGQILLTNYERVRDGDIDPGRFCGVALDEASVLRSYGSKMGVGCPEYILLFRKLPTDRSKAYADDRVEKNKEDYPLSQWQLDAHAFWRSSGNRNLDPDELSRLKMSDRMRRFREYSKTHVYDYEQHAALSYALEQRDAISKEFMTLPPASTSPDVWDDISRMKTLNTTQSQRRKQLHVCPLQLDIVERIINRYSNPGDLVFDPFAGLGTVPMMAVRMHRRGCGCELNPGYFSDAVAYLRAEDAEVEQPSLFDMVE